MRRLARLWHCYLYKLFLDLLEDTRQELISFLRNYRSRLRGNQLLLPGTNPSRGRVSFLVYFFFGLVWPCGMQTSACMCSQPVWIMRGAEVLFRFHLRTTPCLTYDGYVFSDSWPMMGDGKVYLSSSGLSSVVSSSHRRPNPNAFIDRCIKIRLVFSDKLKYNIYRPARIRLQSPHY